MLKRRDRETHLLPMHGRSVLPRHGSGGGSRHGQYGDAWRAGHVAADKIGVLSRVERDAGYDGVRLGGLRGPGGLRCLGCLGCLGGVLGVERRNDLNVEEDLTVALHAVRGGNEGDERDGVGIVVEDEILVHEGVNDGIVLQGNEIRLVAFVLIHFD